MLDPIEKVRVYAGRDLQPGERIRAARVVQPAALAARRAVAGGAFAHFGAGAKILMDRAAAKYTNEQRAAMERRGGMAVGFPTGRCFLTLTDRRVLVHSFDTMAAAPKDLLFAHGLTEFAGIDAPRRAPNAHVTLVMADGSSVPLEVFAGGGEPEDLADAFNDAIERVARSSG